MASRSWSISIGLSGSRAAWAAESGGREEDKKKGMSGIDRPSAVAPRGIISSSCSCCPWRTFSLRRCGCGPLQATDGLFYRRAAAGSLEGRVRLSHASYFSRIFRAIESLIILEVEASWFPARPPVASFLRGRGVNDVIDGGGSGPGRRCLRP